MIRQFTLNLAANETREAALSGVFFQIFQMLQSLVLIEILDKSGGVISLIDSPLESMYIRATERYQTLRFSNGPTAQAVKFFYGDGDAGSNRFSGNISGTVGLDAATLAALESIDLNAATIASLTRPNSPNGYFNNTGIIAANTGLTAVTPAANTGGLIVTSAYLQDFSSASYGGQFWLHDTAAPAALSATAGVILSLGNNTGATSAFANLPSPVFVPAGRGLYFLSTITSNSAQAYRGVSWRAL